MIQDILFGELHLFYWMIFIMTCVTFIAMLFFDNEETPEKNLELLNKCFLFLFGSLILIVTQLMFSKSPELAGVFTKSIFIPITTEEQSQIALLKIPPYLIMLNTVFIAAFSYFGVRVLDQTLNSYSRFLTQEAKNRRAHISKLQKKHLTKKGLMNAFIYASFSIMFSTLLKSCT